MRGQRFVERRRTWIRCAEGDVVLDGGSTATYAVQGGELAVGDNTPNQTSLTLKSGTLNVGTFTSVGRGNGAAALESTLNVTAARSTQ
jgi:hypothetical protein